MNSTPRDAHQAMGPGHEFDAIRRLMTRWGPLARGLGDDAAVLDDASDARVISTDSFVEDVHFWRAWLTPEEVGARAATAALSDIAAMGAQAREVLVSAVLPGDWQSHLEALADGIAAPVRDAGACIVGGNLSHGATFSLTLTVLGTARRPVPRAGAQPGDLIVVTGALGGPGQALAAWLAGRTPDEWARARFARPQARLAEGQWLADAGATAMLDVSDGLAADARHLEAASDVVLDIDPARVPCGPGVRVEEALASGEEYELLATLPPSALAALQARWPEAHAVPLSVIGSVRAGQRPGRVTPAAGHDHFAPR